MFKMRAQGVVCHAAIHRHHTKAGACGGLTGSPEFQFLSRATARGPRWGRVGRAPCEAVCTSRNMGFNGSKLMKPNCLQQRHCMWLPDKDHKSLMYYLPLGLSMAGNGHLTYNHHIYCPAKSLKATWKRSTGVLLKCKCLDCKTSVGSQT